MKIECCRLFSHSRLLFQQNGRDSWSIESTESNSKRMKNPEIDFSCASNTDFFFCSGSFDSFPNRTLDNFSRPILNHFYPFVNHLNVTHSMCDWLCQLESLTKTEKMKRSRVRACVNQIVSEKKDKRTQQTTYDKRNRDWKSVSHFFFFVSWKFGFFFSFISVAQNFFFSCLFGAIDCIDVRLFRYWSTDL